jgi:hypothetical protein
VQKALAMAQRCRQLPADYTDVTEGWLANWKRRIKRKLLNNFKLAYVDVLSRQQSAFNQFVLTALEELAECCATLDHKGRTRSFAHGETHGGDSETSLEELRRELAENRQQCTALEERLARLEAVLKERLPACDLA